MVGRVREQEMSAGGVQVCPQPRAVGASAKPQVPGFSSTCWVIQARASGSEVFQVQLIGRARIARSDRLGAFPPAGRLVDGLAINGMLWTTSARNLMRSSASAGG